MNAIGGRFLESEKRGTSGFSVLDVLLATLILVILGTALVSATQRSRAQLDYEEVRRRAILIAQERLETVRADFRFDDINAAAVDTSFAMEGTTFDIGASVGIGIDPANADSLDDYMKTVSDTVSWTAQSPEGNTLRRSVTMKTVIFRGL